MSVSIWQATLFGIFACLASLPGMGGTVVGNYTLGRPLVGGLICGLIMGDVATGIIAGAAIQIVYIALITPGGAVAADVRAISYIGVPLSIIAITNMGLTGAKATSMAWSAFWTRRASWPSCKTPRASSRYRIISRKTTRPTS